MWMGSKQLTYADEARQKMLAGASKLARAVRCTLGPRGRNAVIDKGWGSPTVTKDGVTVGSSSNAAITAALMQVVPSRVGMAHPVAAPAIFIPSGHDELLGKDKDFRQEPVAEGTGHSTSDGHVFDLLYSTLLRALPSEEDEQLVSRLALLVNK
jgi:hypothetical protein